MKKFVFICLLVFPFLSLNAQVDFQEHLITNIQNGSYHIHPEDVDADGDVDILCASLHADEIVWFENLDGQGTFSEKIIINGNTDGANYVYSADLDGDGDIDVLSSSEHDNKIAWYENLDGLGNFGPQRILTTNLMSARGAFPADFDGDGDLDVISSAIVTNLVVWFENLDGLGNFSSEITISNQIDVGTGVFAADIDGDGDIDALSASYEDDKIAWYENLDGLGNFGPQQIVSSTIDGATSVYACDLDNDGDLDLLSTAGGFDRAYLHRNNDGLGNFGPPQNIAFGLDNVRFSYPADMDGDGDLDVLFASLSDDKISWIENLNGTGSFGPVQVIDLDMNGATNVAAADIDADGDLDIIAAAYIAGDIKWYENLTILSVDEFSDKDIKVYPNPTSNLISIETNLQIEKVQIYDNLGQLLLTTNSFNAISFSNFSTGSYYLKIINTKGNFLIKKILKV